jgi:hypothetical protein
MAGLVHSKIVVGGSEITSRRCCPNSLSPGIVNLLPVDGIIRQKGDLRPWS